MEQMPYKAPATPPERPPKRSPVPDGFLSQSKDLRRRLGVHRAVARLDIEGCLGLTRAAANRKSISELLTADFELAQNDGLSKGAAGDHSTLVWVHLPATISLRSPQNYGNGTQGKTKAFANVQSFSRWSVALGGVLG